MEQIYEEYAVIESEIARLAEQKEALREKILTNMIELDEKKIETSFGSFSKSSTKKWVYPEEVIAKKDEYDALKAKSESTGEATFTETPSLRFTKAKL